MARMKSTQKIARRLKRKFKKKIENRKSNKIFKKDATDIARELNQNASILAKKQKRKVSEVQKEIIDFYVKESI